MVRFCSGLFLFLALSCIHGSYGAKDGLPGLLEAVEKLKGVETLNYGNSCSYNNELKRIDVTTKIADKLFNLPTDINLLRTHFDDITKEMTKLASNVGRLCNSQKLLQCQRSGKCGCANSNYMNIEVHSTYENGLCRLVPGNMCVPEDSIQALGSNKPEIKCGSSTTCKLRSTGRICTTPAMTQEILQSIDTRDFANIQRNIRDKMKDTCVCLA